MFTPKPPANANMPREQKPMSPVGAALFDMCKDMNRIYADSLAGYAGPVPAVLPPPDAARRIQETAVQTHRKIAALMRAPPDVPTA